MESVSTVARQQGGGNPGRGGFSIYAQDEATTEDLLMLRDLLQTMNMYVANIEKYNAALLELISQSRANTMKFID